MSRNGHAVVRVITNLAHHVTVAVIGTNLKALLSSLSNRNVHEEHAQREQDSHRAGYDTGNREALPAPASLDLLQGQGAQNNRSDTLQHTKYEETGHDAHNTQNHRSQRDAGSLLHDGSRIRVTCGLAVTISVLLRLLLVRVLLVVVVSGLSLVGGVLAVTVLVLLRGCPGRKHPDRSRTVAERAEPGRRCSESQRPGRRYPEQRSDRKHSAKKAAHQTDRTGSAERRSAAESGRRCSEWMRSDRNPGRRCSVPKEPGRNPDRTSSGRKN